VSAPRAFGQRFTWPSGIAVEVSAARAQAAQGMPQSPSRPKFEPRAGRNDPCPCGSGKKYKKCHLPTDEAQG